MSQLVGQVVSGDEQFRKQLSQFLRVCSIPVGLSGDRQARDGAPIDFIVVDIRADGSAGMATIERLRASAPNVGIFVVASATEPDLILEAMRAGANEFFSWPPATEAFDNAIRRIAARRQTTPGAISTATTLVFFGAKGGAGTTTVTVNCGVELARLSKRSTLIVDLKPGLGEIALFLGVRHRFSVLDAIDNLHRLDREYLRGLVTKHKSGLDILAGSDNFDRLGSSDSGSIEELFRLLERQYEYIVVDTGSQLNACTVAALHAADAAFLVANPDVPSVRNAQRLLVHVRQLGACGDRVKFLLNRAAEPFPIPLRQIEAAVGQPVAHTFPSDYNVVSTALNSGVPLALSGDSEIAQQFDRFTRQILGMDTSAQSAPDKRSRFGFEKLASLW
jgi:pilus assembly protein CpaE